MKPIYTFYDKHDAHSTFNDKHDAHSTFYDKHDDAHSTFYDKNDAHITFYDKHEAKVPFTIHDANAIIVDKSNVHACCYLR